MAENIYIAEFAGLAEEKIIFLAGYASRDGNAENGDKWDDEDIGDKADGTNARREEKNGVNLLLIGEPHAGGEVRSTEPVYLL